jgi:hypothetical protein
MRSENTASRSDTRADLTTGMRRDEASTCDAANLLVRGREPRCSEAPAETDDCTPEEAGYGYGV